MNIVTNSERALKSTYHESQKTTESSHIADWGLEASPSYQKISKLRISKIAGILHLKHEAKKWFIQ